ncbi:GGDEF domain-containing protein [Rahnella victoriana]|uniref:diguanylate cyclase n=1 Tax=Rahnella victoriana TaxID=1510570 RepID=A0ABS0DVV2_9GAMM|nr:GGDEF domain-containing protein [Rahnella victoriana]MBF7957102.1 GGDEF domain-containing protein [Rahnella victoriana]TBX34237.1 GGDEF domain-containing protein [Rahnella victoriana]
MDQVINSLDTLYINICVTYASLVFFYFFLSSDGPLGPKSPVHKRILFGLLCGVVSAYLDRDNFHLSDSVYYSFEMIPLVICVFYVGWFSVLCACLVNFALTGLFAIDNLFVTIMIAAICCFKPWKDNSIRTFVIVIIIMMSIRAAMALPYLTSWAIVWRSLVYQLFTVACLFICYHGLGGKFRYVREFFREKQNSSLDFLTKTFNRMGLEEHLKAVQKHHPHFGLAMLDIDFFKKVNDTYGHSVGDDVLVRVANVARMMLRNDDVLARFGGEEFVILIASGNAYECVKCCERIRLAVEKTVFTSPEGTPFHITVSLGVANYQPNKSLQENIMVADGALYQSKHNGRNRTTSV